MSKILQSAKIALVLTLISALIAGVVSLVNQLTYEKIEENLEADRRASITAIFGSEQLSYEPMSELPEEVTGVYTVSEGDRALGYCVNLLTGGFGGDIDLMVGVGEDGRIIGVSIVSMSETPGLGTKVGAASYLAGYIGKSGELTLGREVDGVSGATVSSKAVLAGVNTALQALSQMNLIGGEAE
ncbi:MAG: FMN-binding protein [Clostridia bacterium]|nr:FMN-binding protein [Clostridia bacterium]